MGERFEEQFYKQDSEGKSTRRGARQHQLERHREVWLQSETHRNHCRQDGETAALTYCCGNTALWYTPSGQPFGSFSSKMTHKFTTWASNSTPGYLPKNENICGTKTYTWMFIAALTVTLSNCRNSPSSSECHTAGEVHIWCAATQQQQGTKAW